MDKEADRQCRNLAASQYGVLTRTQSLKSGLSEDAAFRRMRTGAWEPVLPSVYRVAGTPVTWFQRLMAAALWAGPGAAISHRAAAALYGLPGFKRGIVEVSTTQRRQGAPRWVICHRVADRPPAHLPCPAGLPITSADRPLLDLSGIKGIDRKQVERALDEVLRRGLASRFRVAWTAGHSRAPGRWFLKKLIDVRLPGYAPPNGELEAEWLRLLKKAEIPEPVREEVVEEGKFTGRVDFLWPEFGVAVETDGFRWHTSRHAWQRDVTKRNLLARRGYRSITVTWQDVMDRPVETVEALTDLLRKTR